MNNLILYFISNRRRRKKNGRAQEQLEEGQASHLHTMRLEEIVCVHAVRFSEVRSVEHDHVDAEADCSPLLRYQEEESEESASPDTFGEKIAAIVEARGERVPSRYRNPIEPESTPAQSEVPSGESFSVAPEDSFRLDVELTSEFEEMQAAAFEGKENNSSTPQKVNTSFVT
jgi:hypothetical protein